MPTPPIPVEKAQIASEAYKKHGSKSAAAKAIGVERTTFRRHLAEAERLGLHVDDGRRFETPNLPSADLPIEKILSIKDSVFQKIKESKDARKVIDIDLNQGGPFGLLVWGDPHVDDDGCDWGLFRKHTALAKENHDILFSVIVGDLTNNWIGRLAYKFSQQIITARQSFQMVEWWLNELGDSILFGCLGNHDHWNRSISGHSPLEWIMSARSGVIEPYQLRVSINTPNDESFLLDCRHHWKGSSVYNKALAGMAAATKMGYWPDAMICGHWHTSQTTQMKNPVTGAVTHAVRVNGYKLYDTYADREQFPDHNIYESCLLLCDPDAEDKRYRVRVMDLELGVKTLRMMREEWESKQIAPEG